MAENHIARLTRERDEAQATIRATRDELREIIHYLQTPKFHGAGNDYVHISTDIMPKLLRLSMATLEG